MVGPEISGIKRGFSDCQQLDDSKSKLLSLLTNKLAKSAVLTR